MVRFVGEDRVRVWVELIPYPRPHQPHSEQTSRLGGTVFKIGL